MNHTPMKQRMMSRITATTIGTMILMLESLLLKSLFVVGLLVDVGLGNVFVPDTSSVKVEPAETIVMTDGAFESPATPVVLEEPKPFPLDEPEVGVDPLESVVGVPSPVVVTIIVCFSPFGRSTVSVAVVIFVCVFWLLFGVLCVFWLLFGAVCVFELSWGLVVVGCVTT